MWYKVWGQVRDVRDKWGNLPMEFSFSRSIICTFKASILQSQGRYKAKKVREMKKSMLIEILKRLLGGKDNLDFLLKLEKAEIKK